MHIKSRFVVGCFLAIVLNEFAAHGQWAQSLRSGNAAYFLFGTSPRLERYTLTNRQWLPRITLPTIYGPATAFAVDEDTLYVAYGQSVKRYSLSGSNEVHVINTAESVQGIFTDGNVILLNRSVSLYARFTSISKSNNAVIAQFENYIDAVGGASIAPSINKLFGRSLGISPPDIVVTLRHRPRRDKSFARLAGDVMIVLAGRRRSAEGRLRCRQRTSPSFGASTTR